MTAAVKVPSFPDGLKCADRSASISLTAVARVLCGEKLVGNESVRPKSHILSVPHVSQALSWDCGLACLLMVLRTAGNLNQDLSSLHRLFPTRSVWTVDIAHLLRRHYLEVVFTTLTLGTNPGFVEESFYTQMHEDEIRVQRLFEDAKSAGIRMQQRSVPAVELQNYLLGGQHVVIALVDKSILESGLALWSEPSHHPRAPPGYKGHYIVICGYDSDTDHYILRDPDPRTAAMGLCSVRSSVLEAARRAFGTDEDLLIVQLPFFQGISS